MAGCVNGKSVPRSGSERKMGLDTLRHTTRKSWGEARPYRWNQENREEATC